jgi:hypothetical protein
VRIFTRLQSKLGLECGLLLGTGIAAAALSFNLDNTDRLYDVANATYVTGLLAWPWLVLALNTALTFAIVLKIWSV